MSKINRLFLTLAFLLSLTAFAGAECKSSFINPFTDICYQCMFPLRIAGVNIGKVTVEGLEDVDKSGPVCVCTKTTSILTGITTSWYEPARIIETTKDPYCFPTLGIGLAASAASGLESNLSGSSIIKPAEAPLIFQNQHYIMFPLFYLLNIFSDYTSCFEVSGLDIAYVSEIDPTMRDELLGLITHPWELLLANVFATLSCIPDAVTSSVGYPLNPLWWCMGSWGLVSPVSGYTGTSNEVTGNAALAAKTIFKVNLDSSILSAGMLVSTGTSVACDPGVDKCGCVVTPIWWKNHYRLQIVRPVVGSQCIPIGRFGLVGMWDSYKNPPYGVGGKGSQDNFTWLMFRKRLCCTGVAIGSKT